MKRFLLAIIFCFCSSFLYAGQYVLQINNSDHVLARSYIVTESCPIVEIVPEGRTQIIITDEKKYNEILQVYKDNTTHAKFYYNTETKVITWQIDN